MAVVLPVIAAFGAGAAGVAAIGAATTTLGLIAGYATVAGAVLTGVGALTGKKDLVKIGGVLSLAGGIGTLASNAGNAAATGVGEVVDATGGFETAVESTANTGGMAAGGAAAAQPTIAATPTGTEQLVPEQSLMEAGRAQTMGQPGALSTGLPDPGVPMTPPAAVSPVQEAARGMTMNDMQSFWDRVKRVGTVIEKNPTTAKLAGEFVTGAANAYAQGRQEDLLQEQQDYQRSLYEQGRANLNRPIRITYGGKP